MIKNRSEFPTDELGKISKKLSAVSETVSTAESVTSGYLQFLLSQMLQASEIYKGGITAYTLQEKVNLLKVDEKEAKKCDCVSSGISNKMALHTAELFGTDWGIAVTGYATPVQESGFQLFAFFSFAYQNKIIHTEKIELNPDAKGPDAQIHYAEHIITAFKNKCSKHHPA